MDVLSKLFEKKVKFIHKLCACADVALVRKSEGREKLTNFMEKQNKKFKLPESQDYSLWFTCKDKARP